MARTLLGPIYFSLHGNIRSVNDYELIGRTFTFLVGMPLTLTTTFYPYQTPHHEVWRSTNKKHCSPALTLLFSSLANTKWEPPFSLIKITRHNSKKVAGWEVPTTYLVDKVTTPSFDCFLEPITTNS